MTAKQRPLSPDQHSILTTIAASGASGVRRGGRDRYGYKLVSERSLPSVIRRGLVEDRGGVLFLTGAGWEAIGREW